MPLEIKELYIKATMGEQQGNAGNAQSGGNGGGDKDAIIHQCVDEILKVLKNKAAR